MDLRGLPGTASGVMWQAKHVGTTEMTVKFGDTTLRPRTSIYINISLERLYMVHMVYRANALAGMSGNHVWKLIWAPAFRFEAPMAHQSRWE